VSRFKRTLVRRNIADLGIVLAVVALVALAPVQSQTKRVAVGTAQSSGNVLRNLILNSEDILDLPIVNALPTPSAPYGPRRVAR
jgi:hypothetical protein